MLISRFVSQLTYLVLFFICFCIITSPSLISTIIIGNKAERICPKQTEYGQDLLRVTDWICMRWSVSITVQVWRSDRSGRGNQGIPHYHRVPLGPRVFRLTGDDLIKHNIEALRQMYDDQYAEDLNQKSSSSYDFHHNFLVKLLNVTVSPTWSIKTDKNYWNLSTIGELEL